MKKTLLLLLWVLSCSPVFAAEDIPYDCVTMSNTLWKGYANSTPTWTNLSNTSNKPSGCASTGFVRIWRASEVSNIDAWISSPELNLTAGKSYKITFYYVTWGDATTHADLFEGRLTPAQVTSADLSAQYSAITPFFAQENVNGTKNTTWHKAEYTATAVAGDRHVTFRFSGKYCKCIGITDFHIEEAEDPSAPGAPEAATGVTATADADGALSAVIRWTLPSLDVKGNALAGIDAVEVLRDDAVVATLDGTATTWTDSEADGLTAGVHTYTVRIKANGLESTPSEKVTVKVGPWDYIPADFSEWSRYSSTANQWVSFSTKPANSLQSESMRIWAYSMIGNIDSWLTSPRLDMVAGKTYKLKFKYLVFYDNEAIIEHFRGHLASETPDADNSARIAASPAFIEMDNVVKGANSSDWKEVTQLITAAEGEQYVTFHVFGKYCKSIAINDFSIETYVEKPFIPAPPTGLKATAGANHALTVALEWTNPTRDAEGDLFPADKTIESILVYRDGALAATLAGDVTSWTDTEADGLTAGDHTYAVSAVVTGVESALSEEATVANVGPLLPQNPASWSSGFATDATEFENLWCTYAGPDNRAFSWRYQQNSIRLINTQGLAEDMWLMTPPFMFTPGQHYTLTIEGSVSYPTDWDDEYSDEPATGEPHPLTLALTDNVTEPTINQYIINQTKPEADHTVAFGTTRRKYDFDFYYDPLNLAAPVSLRSAYDNDTPHYIAIHANSTGIKANTFIYSLKIEEVPGKVTGVENVTASEENPVTVEVYDLTGRKLGKATSLQPEEYASGIYVISATYPDGTTTTQKIIR